MRARMGIGRLAAAAVAAAAVLGASTAHAADRGAPLTEPAAALEQSLECGAGVDGAARAPVVLVHGTGSNPEESFSYGYAAALPKLGIPVCTVALPERALVDIQRSMQYVVHAIREVSRRSGREVSLIGHSQGALHAVFSSHFWPDLPGKVDDAIGLAGPYFGTRRANDSCADGRCGTTSWQFRFGSKLNGAFAAARRPEGVSFTAVATAFDELVTPAPAAARLPGASNVVVQDLCPGRPVDHYAIAADAVAYAMAVDALAHPGPADPARFDPLVCAQGPMPGSDTAGVATKGPVAITNAAATLAAEPQVDHEPPLVCPFDADACRSAASAGAPEVRLTRRCIGRGRLEVRLTGEAGQVRDVNFKLDKRLVVRDTAAPFRGVIPPSRLARTDARRLRAVVYVRDGEPFRLIRARSLPRCGTR